MKGGKLWKGLAGLLFASRLCYYLRSHQSGCLSDDLPFFLPRRQTIQFPLSLTCLGLHILVSCAWIRHHHIASLSLTAPLLIIHTVYPISLFDYSRHKVAHWQGHGRYLITEKFAGCQISCLQLMRTSLCVWNVPRSTSAARIPSNWRISICDYYFDRPWAMCWLVKFIRINLARVLALLSQSVFLP